MKSCPRCHATEPDKSRFCTRCGTALDNAPGPEDPDYKTVLARRAEAIATDPFQQELDLKQLFQTKPQLLIGREKRDCDLFLPHPTVSRYHARLEKVGSSLQVVDLNSDNGVWVGGRRIKAPTYLDEGVRLGIGPFLLTIRNGVLHTIDNSRGMLLEAQHLEKVIPLPGGLNRKLLDNINLVINPGEFVTLLGPSGSGKSTLMDCLNGRRRATGGRVLANGEDFYKHFENFRQSLGYVPQKDIVHTQLTVYRALYYTASLRLPRDTPREDVQGRLERILQAMELEPHRNTLVGNLSGGQIKRVSLGAELLAQPSLLFIDEATSGLDAGTEGRMMRLFRELADEGRSLVCITHNVEHVDECHLVLILARGKMVYYGPPGEAPAWFKVKKISDIYDRLAERDPAEWESLFLASPLYQAFVQERLAHSSQTRVPFSSGYSTLPPGRISIGEQAPQPATEPLEGSAGTDKPPREPVPDTEPLPEQPAAPPEWAQGPLLAGFASSPVGKRLFRLYEDGRKLLERSRLPLLGDRFRALTTRYLRIQRITSAVGDSWHQFLVLTQRYLELILGDRRALGLLLMQAPLVAVFLLCGFVARDFTKPMPRLRELNAEERRLLTVFEGLGHLLEDDQPLDEEQSRALRGLHLKVEMRGVPAQVDGTQLVQLLRQLQSDDLTPDQQAILEGTRFTLSIDDKDETFTGAELAHGFRDLRKSRIPDQLLRVSGPVVPHGEMQNPRFTYILLFILVLVVLWFGCNNAAKEIVKEEAIYGRERTVNLGILPYLASKFVVLGLITILQVLLLMGLLYGPLQILAWFDPRHNTMPSPHHMLDFGPQFGVLVLVSLTGVVLGLLLSACVSNPDRANALLPYVLIPQMILGGGILSVESGLLHWLAVVLSPVYWAYRAVHCGAWDLPSNFPGFAIHPDEIHWPCLALVVQTGLLLLLTAIALRRKDV
jgi:ABC-type multidrug transport system ATPase subunit